MYEDRVENALRLVRFWCGADARVRGVGDPVFRAVTEGRYDTIRGYSSCGDLPHAMLFASGVRLPWVNRAEHDGWHWGELPNRRWDNNITTLVAQGSGTWGVNDLAYQYPATTDLLRRGDMLVLDCGFPMLTGTRGPTHACVVLEVRPGFVVTGDYGQPGGAVRERPVSSNGDRLMLGSRQIDSVLRLEDVFAAAERAGLLTGFETSDSWSSRKGLTPGVERTPVGPPLVAKVSEPFPRGGPVQRLQEKLVAQGVYSGAVDGVAGVKTAQALIDYAWRLLR